MKAYHSFKIKSGLKSSQSKINKKRKAMSHQEALNQNLQTHHLSPPPE